MTQHSRPDVEFPHWAKEDTKDVPDDDPRALRIALSAARRRLRAYETGGGAPQAWVLWRGLRTEDDEDNPDNEPGWPIPVLVVVGGTEEAAQAEADRMNLAHLRTYSRLDDVDVVHVRNGEVSVHIAEGES